MYRIHICDSGYEVLCEMIKEFASKYHEEGPSKQNMAAILGCMLLMDDLRQATHIKDDR